MSIVKVSELDGVTGLTNNSLFLVSYGDTNPRVSKYISVDDLFVYRSSYRYYGAFSSTITQSTTGGTQSFTYDSVDLANGMTTGTTSSQIVVQHAGTYNIQFSAQIQRLQGGNSTNMFIWFSKNGNPIPNSNTAIGFSNNNQYMIAAWNIIETFNTNDYFEIMWASVDPEIQIVAVPSPAYGPTIPSIITTITQI
jgi:hypothetical protein